MTQPVARANDLDRTAALSPGANGSPDFWTEVHEHVQQQLAILESEVRRRVSGVRVDKGRTQGNQFYLFSYRTFSIPDSGLDPVVSGMTFTRAQQGVTVEADVSGEQMGDCISPVPSKTVANRMEEILAAAVESARKLCQSAEAIAAALEGHLAELSEGADDAGSDLRSSQAPQ
jgi:hypothetical protein